MKSLMQHTSKKTLLLLVITIFGFGIAASAAEDKKTGKTLVTEISPVEKDIEMENWMLNLDDWKSMEKIGDSAINPTTELKAEQVKEITKHWQNEIQVTETEKDIAVESWMTNLSNW
jgi:hypothetical protein